MRNSYWVVSLYEIPFTVSYYYHKFKSQNWHRRCLPLFMDDTNQIPSLTFYEYGGFIIGAWARPESAKGSNVSWCNLSAGQVWIDDSGSKNRGQVFRK